MNKNKNFSVRKVIEKNNVAGYVFALPFIIGFSAFIVVPMAMSLYFSFCDYNILSPEKWVGLKNYDGLFQDPKFWNSLKVTLKYAVFAVPLKLLFSLLVALLLLRATRLTPISVSYTHLDVYKRQEFGQLQKGCSRRES